MSDWNFCDLVENAGYDSHKCFVVNDTQFGYKHEKNGYKYGVFFNAEGIEQAKDREQYIKTKLDITSIALNNKVYYADLEAGVNE